MKSSLTYCPTSRTKSSILRLPLNSLEPQMTESSYFSSIPSSTSSESLDNSIYGFSIQESPPCIGSRHESKWCCDNGVIARFVIENVTAEPQPITLTGKWPALLLKWGDSDIGHLDITIQGDWCDIKFESSILGYHSLAEIVSVLKISGMGLVDFDIVRFRPKKSSKLSIGNTCILVKVHEEFSDRSNPSESIEEISMKEESDSGTFGDSLIDIQHEENYFISQFLRNGTNVVGWSPFILSRLEEMVRPKVEVNTFYGNLLEHCSTLHRKIISTSSSDHFTATRDELNNSSRRRSHRPRHVTKNHHQPNPAYYKDFGPVAVRIHTGVFSGRKNRFLIIAVLLSSALAAVTVATNPGCRETWFEQLQDVVFVWGGVFLPLFLAARNNLTGSLSLKIPTERPVKTIEEVRMINQSMSYQEILECAAWSKTWSKMLCNTNMSFKVTDMNGPIIVDEQANFSDAIKKFWKFGKTLAFHVLSRRAFPYEVTTEMDVRGVQRRVITIERDTAPMRKRKWFIGGELLDGEYLIR